MDLKQCHYLVDLALETEAPREPRYAANKEEWSIIVVKPFLDSSRSVQFYFISVWFTLIAKFAPLMSKCFLGELTQGLAI